MIEAIWRRLETTTSVDLVPRWNDAIAFVTSILIDSLSHSKNLENPLPIISLWREESISHAINLTRSTRDTFFTSTTSPTSAYLGSTRKLYEFVRIELGVQSRRGDVYLGKQEATIGSNVSRIYESIKDGRMGKALVEMMN